MFLHWFAYTVISLHTIVFTSSVVEIIFTRANYFHFMPKGSGGSSDDSFQLHIQECNIRRSCGLISLIRQIHLLIEESEGLMPNQSNIFLTLNVLVYFLSYYDLLKYIFELDFHKTPCEFKLNTCWIKMVSQKLCD